MTTKTKPNVGRYRDLDAIFTPHPATADVRRRIDAEAVKFAVKSLVMTKYYERLFQPNIGSNVPNLLFEQMSPITTQLLRDSIVNVIQNYEPRVTIDSVDIEPDYDDQSYDVNIRFTIQNLADPITLNFVLSRTR